MLPKCRSEATAMVIGALLAALLSIWIGWLRTTVLQAFREPQIRKTASSSTSVTPASVVNAVR
ncbi:hypothetical protein D3C73_1284760 [compost metagenome]